MLVSGDVARILLRLPERRCRPTAQTQNTEQHDGDVDAVVVAQSKRRGGQGGHQTHMHPGAPVGIQPRQPDRRDVQEDFRIAVQPGVGQGSEQRHTGGEPARAGEPRGEMEHEQRAERDQRAYWRHRVRLV